MAKLRSQFSYKLVTPAAPEDVNPVEHFLFKTRTGNCEYFAGALCLLLRSVGVPARVVEGFAGGEKTAEPSEILVRFSMAHAWVEALLDGSPWTVLDPTPEMRGESLEDILWRLIADAYYQAEYQWIRQVVHFDRSDQTAMLQRIRGMLAGDISPGWLLSPQARAVVPAILIAGLCAGIVMVYLQMRRKWLDPSAIYLDTMRQLVRAGVLEKMEPWYERNTASILARVPEARESYLAFMDIYLRARFDPAETVAPERLRAARNVLLAKVKMALSSI
jgi:hypothetical protein